MDETAQTFVCPSCGASLQPTSGAATMKCGYCGTSVIVPENLRASPQSGQGVSSLAGLSFGQLITGAIQMGEVVRLAGAGKKAEAIHLYRENTGVDADQAEKVIDAIASGDAPNSDLMEKEAVTVGKAIAAERMGRQPGPLSGRNRRARGISCSGLIVFIVIVVALYLAIQNSTGPAHDFLTRITAQFNVVIANFIH